jgi:hypothetical protein
VPIRPVPEQEPLPWPLAEEEVVPFLRALHTRLSAAVGFVADRRELCELLVSPRDVRRGDVVADLRAGYVERVVRALVVAQLAGDREAASVALAILQAPPAGGPTDGPSSLLDQAHIWADQWSHQSGIEIVIPDAIDLSPAAVGSGHLPDGSFWERVG